MSLSRLLVSLGLLVAAAAPVRAAKTERNRWPVYVSQLNAAGETESWESLGPLLFKKPAENGGVSTGFRPFYVQTKDAHGKIAQALFIYPIFSYAADEETSKWSILELIRHSGRKAGAPNGEGTSPEPEIFEVWPFWFSRQNANDPAGNYHALFPIAGRMKNRFGFQELSWALFPFYFRADQHGTVTTSTPWPFVRVIRGTSQGFALWPLFGWKNGPGEAHEQFYLWPLIYNNTRPAAFDAPPGSPPERQVAFLPFYSREQSAGFLNINYGWPFFGFTDRTLPYRYHETRYFWPFFLQARGDDRYRNRWAPFYTHSNMTGYDKTWVMWPIYRQGEWTDDNVIIQKKRQLLFFLYYSVDQRSATNPHLAHANKTHYWPLLTKWDNGAGQRQLQVFSPFEVFFPTSDKMRQVWTPLVAIYRYDQPAPGYSKQSFLWNAVTYRREPERSEFHLGPLFSIERDGAGRRVALIKGLISLKRGSEGRGWRVLWLDFPAKNVNSGSATQ